MRKSWLFLIPFFSSVVVVAQPGTVDVGFNSADIGYRNGDCANDAVRSIAFQPDGKILIGGFFTSYNGSPCNFIARLNADGSLDDSFNTGSGANQGVFSSIIQPDGKIVLGGIFNSFNGIACGHMVRLNPDGSVDASFNQGTGADNAVMASARQADGKIIIGGGFGSYNGTGRNHVARILTDGSLDTSFDPGSGTDGVVSAIALQTDGKILLGGIFNAFNGMPSKNIARINTDGSLDTSFQIGAGPDSYVATISIQQDGKLVVGGYFTSFNGTMANRIVRLDVDGTVDSTFNSGTGASNTVLTTTLQSDGKIIIGGEFLMYNGTSQARITRLNPDGSIDPFFNSGTGADYTVSSAAVQGDGRICIGGYFSSYNRTARNYFMRMHMDGSLDPSFNPGTGANAGVRSILLQSDGKAILSGEFTWCNGTVRHHIARIGTDGTLDSTFDQGTGANERIFTSALQPDGKIVVGGVFNAFNGMYASRIARLNADGTVDSTFNSGSGPNQAVQSVAIQDDGKILLGGAFHEFNGTNRNYIARLYEDGSIDSTFNPGTGANMWVSTIALQQDGKILIGGEFTSYAGTPCNHIARLNTDGSIDTTFNVGEGAEGGFVTAISVQPDGKIFIGGNFSSYNGTPHRLVTRLNPDGSLDGSFDPGIGMEGLMVRALSPTADGKVIVGGEFYSYAGTSRPNIVMLNSDGSLDLAFNPGSGPDDMVWAIASLPDGKILIGGDFVSCDGIGRNRFARLFGDIGTYIARTPENMMKVSAWPNPVACGKLNLMAPCTGSARIQVYDTIGRLRQSQSSFLQDGSVQIRLGEDLTTGHYTVRITTVGGIGVVPIVIQ